MESLKFNLLSAIYFENRSIVFVCVLCRRLSTGDRKCVSRARWIFVFEQ